MKRIMLAAVFALGLFAAVEAQEATVSQNDIKVILERLAKLEAENKAQAARIVELEKGLKSTGAKVELAKSAGVCEESTTTNGSGRIYTTEQGRKYYLADKVAGIFEPLTESGLQFQPYGYLVLEGIYNTHGTDLPMFTDYVRPKNAANHGGKDHTATLSICDSILGFNVFTPETYAGWKFNGKFEFDLANGNINDWGTFHIRHLFWNMEHEESGWSVLFGQTWHLWKMVTPSEIDGAWMEFTGHPYRRSPQIRVTKKWDWEDSSLEARVGFVKGGPGMSGDRDDNGTEDNEQSAWGLFEGALVYEHDAAWASGRNWLVGVGGHYGRTNIHRQSAPGVFDGPDDDYNSSMIMLAGSIPFSIKDIGNFTLCGQIFAGENLGDVQGGAGNKIAFKDPTRKGREIATVGGFVDLNYELNDKWSFAIGYGFDNPAVRSSDVEIYTRGWEGTTFNDRAYLDAFYQWNENLHFGFEYAYLTTDYVSPNKDNDSHRFQFSVYYDF